MWKKNINMFFMNQSILDLVACCLTIFSQVYRDIDDVPVGLGAEFYCSIWLSSSLNWTLYTASIYNLTALSIEQYFAISKPLRWDIIPCRYRENNHPFLEK